MNTRPTSFDLPLFLHVLGAMTLFGAVLTAAVLGFAAWHRPDAMALRRSMFVSLLAVAVPAYVVMRVGGQWIYSKEGFDGKHDPTWLGVGFALADTGLVLLLLATGFAFWWRRSGKLAAARIATGLSAVYLVLLAVAWLAMSGKWGS